MTVENPNTRLETFCDGVFAIALMLLIIDIKLPSTVEFSSTNEIWQALKHIMPSIFAFILSFIIIFITWVNHHNAFKMVNKSSISFIYANGFLLLTVVFIPFPTSLVGENILSDHSTPAVFLYTSIIAFQGIGWVLISGASLKNDLAKNENAIIKIKNNRKNGYFTFIVYSILAIISFWFPLIIATVTTMTLIFWLFYGAKMKHE